MMPLYNDRQHFNTGAGGYFSVCLMDFCSIFFKIDENSLVLHRALDLKAHR